MASKRAKVELSASFYNFDKTDIGSFPIGRVTLSGDAVGTWSLLTLTADRQRVDLVGTVTQGVMELDVEATSAATLLAYQNSAEYRRLHPP